MDYFPADNSDANTYELLQLIESVAQKHNDLVVSVSFLWSVVQLSTTDPMTRRMCAKRLEEMAELLYQDKNCDRPDSTQPLSANEYSGSPPPNFD